MRNDVPMMRKALEEFKRTESVYTREADPVKWAMVEVNSGELLCHMAARTRSLEPLAEAKKRTNLALEQFREHGVDSYAQYAKNLLGYIRQCRPELKDGCGCTPAE